jgi:hypothetical protein
MPCSRTALAQLADLLTGRSRRPERPWTVEAQNSARNPVEAALLAAFFTGFAWLLAFEVLVQSCPGWRAGLLAVPAAFVVLQVIPISLGLVIDWAVGLARRRMGWTAHWVSEEIHLLLATGYAAVCQVDWARGFCRVWLALVALNAVAFLVLCVVKSSTARRSAHA